MTAWSNITCPTVAATPTDRAHFFGFHDVTPWAPANDRLAVLRVDPALRSLPSGGDVAEVCVWQPDDGGVEAVGETRAWNFQMGARVQWLPDGRLIWNTLADGRLGAEILDTGSGVRTRLDFPVSAISPDGGEAVSPHFGRLARHWPAYGVAGASAPSVDTPAPANDGLWHVDIRTGAVRLLLSLAEVTEFRRTSTPPDIPHFVTHPLYSPSGVRIAFIHRFLTADGSTYSRLLVCRRDGSELTLLAEEKVSHFCWRDDDTLLVWCWRLPGALAAARRHGLLALPVVLPLLRRLRALSARAKQRLANEHYFLIPVTAPSERRVVGAGTLLVDGHPMFAGDGRRFITDTYPDADRLQHLMICDSVSGARTDIGEFHADLKVGDGDIKCDLHPRWDRHDRLVCVDTSQAGVRQCVIVDASPALAGGGDVL